MLDLRNVSGGYGNGVVVHGISLSVARGETSLTRASLLVMCDYCGICVARQGGVEPPTARFGDECSTS